MLLCESFGIDYIPDTPVLVDYWGKNIADNATISLIYGVYKGLHYSKGVTAALFHKCFLANRLDELIHKKYQHKKSGYYLQFVEQQIIIGNTYHDFRSPDDPIQENIDFEISDDNHCPSCYCEGYYTENYIFDAPPDCLICYKRICKACSYYDDTDFSYICYQCNTSSLKGNIDKKLSRYKKSDKSKFNREGDVTIEDISQLLKKQYFTCYVCDEPVITSRWKPFCCYQFSVDRIDNNLPHDRTNVLISCYYCNCRHHSEFHQKDKVCSERCHITPKFLPSRTTVDVEKINRLLLK